MACIEICLHLSFFWCRNILLVKVIEFIRKNNLKADVEIYGHCKLRKKQLSAMDIDQTWTFASQTGILWSYSKLDDDQFCEIYDNISADIT